MSVITSLRLKLYSNPDPISLRGDNVSSTHSPTQEEVEDPYLSTSTQPGSISSLLLGILLYTALILPSHHSHFVILGESRGV